MIPFPVHLRRPVDPLAAPELEHHTSGLCDLAISIADEVSGYDYTTLDDAAGEELHERVRQEVLDMLCQLTPVLLDGLRARWAHAGV